MKVDEMLSFMVPMNGSRIFSQGRFSQHRDQKAGSRARSPERECSFSSPTVSRFADRNRRPALGRELIILGGNVRTETEAGSFDLCPIGDVRRFLTTLERFPAKWVPVRVKKTRQSKGLEPPFRFNRNGKGSRQRVCR